MKISLAMFLGILGITILFFALALLEHIWKLDPAEMRRRYMRNVGQRMPKLRSVKKERL